MSTKPPTAVMIPKVSSSRFKLLLDRFQRGGVARQLSGIRIRRQRLERGGSPRGLAILTAQCTRRLADLAPRCRSHAVDISRGKMLSDRFAVYQRPFRRCRSKLLYRGESLAARRACAQQAQTGQEKAAHSAATKRPCPRAKPLKWLSNRQSTGRPLVVGR